MNFEGNDNVNVPEQNSRPYTGYLEYRSGKTPASFAAQATPDQVSAGFSYYDRESNTRIKLDAFRAIIVGQAFGVAGVTKLGDRFTNYYSNLVADTRTDPMRVFIRGINFPQYSGLYKDIKPALPQGVGFQHYLCVYIPEIDQLMLISLTMALSEHIRECIAESASRALGRKLPSSRVNMFGLCDLSQSFYMLKFTGQFVKKNKENQLWNNNGEMYFLPEVEVKSVVGDEQIKFLEQQAVRFGNWLFADIARNVDAMKSDRNAPVQPAADATPVQTAQPVHPVSAAMSGAQQNAKQVMMQAGWTEPAIDDRFPITEPIQESDLPF
jgi:hypothetical protein